MRIIFICTANLCRSVMAEGILNKFLSTYPDVHDIEVLSFGVDALDGTPPDRITRVICLSHGIDVRSHTAQQLTKEMLIQSDYILCMEKIQKQIIVNTYPEFRPKTFLLKEFLSDDPPEDLSIKDPTGKSKKYYLACFNEIEQEVLRIAELIFVKETN